MVAQQVRWALSPRTSACRSIAPLVLALLAGILATFLHPANAQADALDDALAAHTIETVSPSGTSINLFDYWITTRDDPDSAGNGTDDQHGTTGTTGINQDRQFRFTNGDKDAGVGGNQASGGSNNINRWTGRAGNSDAGPNYSLVEDQLVNGFPRLRTGSPYQILRTGAKQAWGVVNGTPDRSLAYLFDSSHIEGKQGYFGVKGLLKYDGSYYVYDSKENFASFNEANNAFDVYDRAGVTGAATAAGQSGMFFPFDSGREVFRTAADGAIESNQTNQYDAALNHYFGLTMRTRFMQPAGGKVTDESGSSAAKTDMIYRFSGDDDVWVYIDGVLVGDIGGIHNEATLDINFRTGAVVVGANTTYEQKTTLRALFEKAQGAAFNEDRFSGDTFADGTVHTLNFFYLERGNSASNLHLMYNLMDVPESSIIKVDQDGDPVQGAKFQLRRANADYVAQGEALAEGVTDENGNLVLNDKVTGDPISFDNLYDSNNADGTTHYLLQETEVPPGYRSAVAGSGDTDGMKLLYTPIPNEHTGVITDAGGTEADGYIWQNGSRVASGTVVTAPAAGQLKFYDNGAGIDDAAFEAGTLFAVYAKRDTGDGATAENLTNENNWYPVTGDPVNGYQMSETSGKQAAIDAAKQQKHVFAVDSHGAYTVSLDDLPGDVMRYYWMINKLYPGNDEKLVSDTRYAVNIYFTKGALEDATEANTRLVDTGNFPAVFNARVYVTNIQNRLFVQKVDEGGNGVAGATFSLYEADATMVGADGKRVVNDKDVAYDRVVTAEADSGLPGIKGGAAFPSGAGRPLETGKTYYLKETAAPDGYQLNDALVPVVVDNDGVHPYAGDAGADEGVRVEVGVGKLVKSLALYGANDSFSATLHNVMAALATGGADQTGELGGQAISWSKPDFGTTDAKRTDLLRLAFGNVAPGQPVYEYGPSNHIAEGGNKNTTVGFDSGWGMLKVRQDYDFGQLTLGKGSKASYTDLGERDLTALFSGSARVVVTDKAASRLEVTKRVETPEGIGVDADAAFTFHVKITPKDGGAVPVQGYLLRVFEADGVTQFEQAYVGGAATADATAGTGEFDVTLKAGQTFRVYGLATGDGYEVSEPGTGMPAGFTLRDVADGDDVPVEVTRADGVDGAVVNQVSGTVAALDADGTVPAGNRLTYVNEIKAVPFSFTKIDGSSDADGKALPGAKFVLLRSLDDAANKGVIAKKGQDGTWGANWGVVVNKAVRPDRDGSVTSDVRGTVDFGNLTAGTYRLVEVDAPAGYQLPTGQWSVVVNPDAAEFEDRIKITQVKNGTAQPPAFAIESSTDDTGVVIAVTYKLPNYKGFALPVSGASGTWVSGAVGLALVAGSLACLWWLRRWGGGAA